MLDYFVSCDKGHHQHTFSYHSFHFVSLSDVDEVEESKMILGLHLQSMAPELMVKEAIQEAAYSGQALGRPHFVTPETLPRWVDGRVDENVKRVTEGDLPRDKDQESPLHIHVYTG